MKYRDFDIHNIPTLQRSFERHSYYTSPMFYIKSPATGAKNIVRSLALLNDSVEAFLRRDYFLDDSIVDKTEEIRSLAWVLAGIPFKDRGKRADEFIQTLKRIWTDDVVEFRGKFYNIPPSKIGPKPVQVLSVYYSPSTWKPFV